MKWNKMLERNGYVVNDAGASIDPFAMLAAHAQAAGLPVAHVTFNVSSSLEYGTIKCGASVTVTCPQTEQAMNTAAEAAFRKAVELVNDGASHLELPLLPGVEDA